MKLNNESEETKMDWLSGPLPIGTWVKLDGRKLKNFTGFITKFDYEEERYRVQLTINADGLRTEGSLWVDSEDVIPAVDEGIDEDFLLGLIDITLFLNQKEWFLELTSTEVSHGNHPALTKR
jgi:hypothetical protein